jgi:hypothetical protein
VGVTPFTGAAVVTGSGLSGAAVVTVHSFNKNHKIRNKVFIIDNKEDQSNF